MYGNSVILRLNRCAAVRAGVAAAYGIDASHPDPMEERFEKLCRELENVKKELAELKKEKKNDAK